MAIGRIPEPGTGIPESIVDAKGDIITATAADTPARLAVGTNDHRLVAASGEATGLKYVADTQNTVVDAKGDLLVGTAADTIARLAVGTNGYTLVADSAETTGLKWQAPASGSTFVGVSVYRGSAKSIANNTETLIDFDNEIFDTDGFHSNSVNNTRLTVPSGKGGYYLIIATLPWASNANGERQIILNKNGSDNLYFLTTPGAQATTNPVSVIRNLSAGDYIELEAYQTSGGNLNVPVAGGTTYNHFSMYLIGA